MIQIKMLDVIRKSALVFLPLLALLLVIALLIFDARTRSVEASLRLQEKTVLALQKKVIAEDIDGVVSDVRFLEDLLRTSEQVWVNNESATVERKAIASLILNLAKAKRIYDQIRIVDEHGMEKLRVNYNNGSPEIVADADLQDKGDRYYFTDTISLDKGALFVSPLDLNIEHGQIEQPLKPMIRIGSPVFSDSGEKFGIVLVNYLASLLLERFRELGEAKSGAPLLVNSAGYYLLAQGEEDAWGFMYPDRVDRNLSKDFPEEWGLISANDEGQFHGKEGLFTYTTIHPVPIGLISSTGSSVASGSSLKNLDSDEVFWKAISFLPDTVYHAESIKMRHILIPAVIVAGLLLWVSIYRHSYSRIYKKLTQQQTEVLVGELQQSLAEVKTLKGILPICMHCKKIRSDDEAWNKIESYLSKRTDLQFSHAICPDCMKEHYQRYVKKPS